MLRDVDGPVTPAAEVGYDSMCNLWWSDTPSNYRTYYYKDGIGRDTLIVTPIDGSNTGRQRITYDIMDRVDETETIGPAVSYSTAVMSGSSPADTMWVGNTYDEEGNLTNVSRAAGGELVGSINYTYDKANRRITESRGHGGRDSTFYDAAGNVTKVVTRRGHTITMKYDVMDRLIRRSVPQVDYSQTGCSDHGVNGHPGCDLKFPMYPNNGSGLRIAARVDTFGYDVMGNMTRAWNNFSRVTRTYSANGTLATETQTLRRYDDTEFDRHYYNLAYTYDKNGRRTALIHPDSLVPSAGDTVQLYDYTSFGALGGVTNIFGDEHTFSYDAEGRMTGINSPGSSDWTFTYNNDGHVASRLGPYHNETLTYDQRGLITNVNASGTAAYDAKNYYSGLGHVIASHQDWELGDDVIEQFGNDAMGRVTWRRYGGSSSTHPTQDYEYASNGSGRLNRIVGTPADYPPYGWIPDTTYSEYDDAGNVDLSGRRQYYWVDNDKSGADRRASQSYYSADGKLMVQQTYQDSLNNNLVVQKRRGMYEEYWYDALGRRVLIRRRADSICTVSHCYSSIERFAWDGDQILYEIRHPGGDHLSTGALNYSPGASVSPGEQYGIVGYTHGGQVDRPLDVYRMNYEQNPVRFMPTTDYRGTMDAGRTMSSGQFGCEPVWSSGCEPVEWPGEYQNTYRDESEYYRPYDWFGSLVQDKKDGTGLMYMRNRYYDPQTGQFTQEDPIGLAGGLNLYGFAGGDPINFSDPFGLCKKYEDGSEDQNCRRLVNGLNALADEVDNTLEEGATNHFREAAAAYNAQTDREVMFVGPLDPYLNHGGQNSDGSANTNALGRTMDDRFLIRNDLQHGDMMLAATHEVMIHGPERGTYAGDLLHSTRIFDSNIWFQLPRHYATPMWPLKLWPPK